MKLSVAKFAPALIAAAGVALFDAALAAPNSPRLYRNSRVFDPLSRRSSRRSEGRLFTRFVFLRAARPRNSYVHVGLNAKINNFRASVSARCLRVFAFGTEKNKHFFLPIRYREPEFGLVRRIRGYVAFRPRSVYNFLSLRKIKESYLKVRLDEVLNNTTPTIYAWIQNLVNTCASEDSALGGSASARRSALGGGDDA